MLHEQMESMLCNRKTLNSLCRKGYIEYDNEGISHGEVAIISNKALLSFVKDVNDEQNVIAIANLNGSGTLAFQLYGNDFSQCEIGFKDSPGGFYNATGGNHFKKLSRKEVIREIETIYIHCSEAKDNSSKFKIKDLLSGKLTRHKVKTWLGETRQQLERIKRLESITKKKDISPKVTVIQPTNEGNLSYSEKQDKLR